MEKSLFLTKRTANIGFSGPLAPLVDVADNSRLAFLMYLMGHTEGAPYRAIYVDGSVPSRSFLNLKSEISRYERKKRVRPVKLVRETSLLARARGVLQKIFSPALL